MEIKTKMNSKQYFKIKNLRLLIGNYKKNQDQQHNQIRRASVRKNEAK